MLTKNNIMVYSMAVVILLPILFFPVSSDLSVFMLGGKIIAGGGELYKDYFELKAPLTYYFFALLHFITNGNVLLTRFFELLLNIAFLFSINYILKDFRFLKSIRSIYILIFSMSYVALNYSNTLQCETIIFLPALWYFYFIIRKKKYSAIIKGILLGILISFKYTLGIIYFTEFFFVATFFDSKYSFFKSKVVEIIIAVSILFLTFLPTILQGNLIYFYDVLNYLDTYKSYPNLNIEFFKSYIKVLGSLFGDYYSLVFSSAAFVGLIFIKKEKSKFRSDILNVALTIFLLLFFSFIIERKPTLYQFSRTYPFLILISSFGIYYFYKNVKFKNKYIVAFVITFGLILSPLPRVINLLRLPYSYFTQGEKYLYNFSNEGGTGNFKSLLKLKDYTQNHSNKFLFINTGSHQFQSMTNSTYKYPQSAFYLSDCENSNLVDEVLTDIKKMDYIIVQNDDNHLISFFNFGSSYDNLKRKEKLWNEVENSFNKDTIIDGRYVIFTHKATQIKY